MEPGLISYGNEAVRGMGATGDHPVRCGQACVSVPGVPGEEAGEQRPTAAGGGRLDVGIASQRRKLAARLRLYALLLGRDQPDDAQRVVALVDHSPLAKVLGHPHHSGYGREDRKTHPDQAGEGLRAS